jgi:hypothetical protein
MLLGALIFAPVVKEEKAIISINIVLCKMKTKHVIVGYEVSIYF